MKLTTRSLGTGSKKIVFLHGLMGRGKNFTSIAKQLENECTSLLLDLPNHGSSPWTEEFSYDQMADIIAQNLQADFASDAPVDIVGHSMGGKVAMRLALRYPDLVNRLVVLDIAPTASRGNFNHLLGSMLALPLTEFSSRGQANMALAPAVPQEGIRGFLLQNLKKEGEHFVWEPNLTMLYENLDKVMGWEATGAQYQGEVLWVAGELSAYIKPEDSATMRALFPRVRKLTLKGAGHWIHSDKPNETVAILQSFLLGK